MAVQKVDPSIDLPPVSVERQLVAHFVNVEIAKAARRVRVAEKCFPVIGRLEGATVEYSAAEDTPWVQAADLESVLRVAVLKMHDTVVFGEVPLPTDMFMSQLRELLETNDFRSRFAHIVFAMEDEKKLQAFEAAFRGAKSACVIN